jgi:transglutaminase-like putative cysteine protease
MTRRAQGPRSSRTQPVAVVPPRLAWGLWILLAATITPVCQAQGLWLAALAGPLLAGAGIWWTRRRGRAPLGQAVAASIAAVLAALVALISLQTGLIGLYAVADWLIAVGILKCWQLNTDRDCAHVLIVSSLLLLVGAMVSGQIHYAISLMVALTIGLAALMRWHLLAEARRFRQLAGQTGGHVGSADLTWAAEPVRGITAAAALFCAATGFVIFATFPRLRTPLQPNVQAGRAVTGFSAQARLDQISEMQQSDRIYMRVHLSMAGQSIGAEGNLPYFRGMVYTFYNGRSWEAARDQSGGRSVILPNDASLTPIRTMAQSDPPGAVDQEYVVEAGLPPRLFTLAMSLPVAAGSQAIPAVQYRSLDDTLIPMVERLPAVVSYKIRSVPAYLLAGAPARPSTQPPPAVKPEVVELARSLAAEVSDQLEDAATHEQIVDRFLRYLSGPPFRFTLKGQPRGGANRLERFLLETREGHCEYFASALAVMCQCVGIPARYVTGFHGGHYNEVGQFYAVRDSDAHSWVEVWLPGTGWRTFDPTPAAPARYTGSSLRARLASMLDYLQFQWSSWVVAYDVLHRQALFGTLGPSWMRALTFQTEPTWTRYLWMLEQLLIGPETLSPLGKTFYWLALLGVLGLSAYLLAQILRQLTRWLRQRERHRAARASGVRFYQTVVAALARRGLRRRPAETPREFAARIGPSAPQIARLFAELTERYYAVRFGGTDRAEAGRRLSEQILLRLGNGRQRAARPHAGAQGEDGR